MPGESTETSHVRPYSDWSVPGLHVNAERQPEIAAAARYLYESHLRSQGEPYNEEFMRDYDERQEQLQRVSPMRGFLTYIGIVKPPEVTLVELNF